MRDSKQQPSTTKNKINNWQHMFQIMFRNIFELSDIICISFTIEDIIYYSLQIYTYSQVLILFICHNHVKR